MRRLVLLLMLLVIGISIPLILWAEYIPDFNRDGEVNFSDFVMRNMSIRMRQLLREFSEASGAIRECSLVGLSRLRLERVAVSVCL